jgi:preprotein translocase subunit SecY
MVEKLMMAFQVPEIRKRLTFVLMIFAVYIVALHIPASGVNQDKMTELFKSGLLNALDTFSGGAFKKFSVIGLGIGPYINASIVMQLLTVALPQLRELQKEGETGRRAINKYTRYLSIVLALVQSFGYYKLLADNGAIPGGFQFFSLITIMVTMTAGTMFLLWLGEQITEHGIGNGISLLIFVGIMVSLPQQVQTTYLSVQEQPSLLWGAILLLALFLATVVGVIYMTQGTRRIPVQHVRKVVGNRMMQGGQTYLPLKVNTAGVIPVIFAMSIQLFPATLHQFFPNNTFITKMASSVMPGQSIWASLAFAVMVLIFTFFYTSIQFDTEDISQNLNKWGSFIPGIRPGKPTAAYLDKVLTRITLAGAIFLAAICLIQYWTPAMTGLNTFSLVGGTSLLIVVGVALETMQAIEAQMAMRNYEGFIR